MKLKRLIVREIRKWKFAFFSTTASNNKRDYDELDGKCRRKYEKYIRQIYFIELRLPIRVSTFGSRCSDSVVAG